MGYIPHNELSTGVKTLILINTLNMKVNGARMGDNCYPLVAELAEQRDIFLRIKHLIEIDGPVKGIIDNTNKPFNSWQEFRWRFLEVFYHTTFDI